MKIRTAVVRGGADSSAQVAAYLPSNYGVVNLLSPTGGDWFIITGFDVAGWTLDDYVIPRLASGLISAEEVTE